MKTIGDWTESRDVDGVRRAMSTGAAGERLVCVLDAKDEHVAFMRVRCPDDVFDRMKAGAILDESELASVEIVASEHAPVAVLAALLA